MLRHILKNTAFTPGTFLTVSIFLGSLGIAADIVAAPDEDGVKKRVEKLGDLEWLRAEGFILPMDWDQRPSPGLQLNDAKLTDMKAQRLKQCLETLLEEIRKAPGGGPWGLSTASFTISSSEISPAAAEAFSCIRVSRLTLNDVKGVDDLLAAFPLAEKPLTGLTTVSIADSDLTDTGLKSLGPHKNLQSVTFQNVALMGDGFINMKRPKVTNLTRIKLIDLEVTKELLEGIAHCNSARLEIADTKIEGDAFAGLDGLKLNNTISLRGVELDPEALGQLKKMYALRLENMELDSAAFKHVAKVGSLGMVSLNKLKLSDSHLADLSGAEDLNFLLLEDVTIERNDAAIIHPLAQLKDSNKLRTLWFKGAKLEDEDLGAIRKCEKLQSLSFSSTGITDLGLSKLAGLPNLKELTIIEQNVTAEGVAALRKELPRKCKVHFSRPR